jgi:probable addiction module antidote protein
MTKVNDVDVTPFDAAEYLTDEVSIAEFLNASVEMNDPAVLLEAICTVARARSMSQLAEASGLGRESLYKALKPGSQPRYETVMRVLGALGIEMVFKVPKSMAKSRKTTAATSALSTAAASRAAAKGEKRNDRVKTR